jgi:hypothetical protein
MTLKFLRFLLPISHSQRVWGSRWLILRFCVVILFFAKSRVFFMLFLEELILCSQSERSDPEKGWRLEIGMWWKRPE